MGQALNTSWQNSVTYTVSISGNASDISDNALGDNFEFSFTVGSDYKSPKVVFQDGLIDTGTGCIPGIYAGTIDAIWGISDKSGVCTSLVPPALDTSIFVDFSEDMDAASVNSALSISHPITGTKTWSTSSHPQCGSTGTCSTSSRLTFIPSAPWQKTTYTFSLNVSAKDMEGNGLSGYFFSFTPGNESDPPDMDYVTGPLFADAAPVCAGSGLTSIPNFTTDVCSNNPGIKLRMRFDEPMNRQATASAFSINPGIEGIFSWPSASELLFTPSINLELFRQYKISISTLAKDIAGNNLVNEFISFFTTGNGSGTTDNIPPRVSDIRSDIISGPGGCNAGMDDTIFSSFLLNTCTDNSGTGKDASFEIIFSEAMNQVVTSENFSISPAVSGSISWISATAMRFMASHSLQPDTQYKLTISGNASDLAGNRLQSPLSTFFQTASSGGFPGISSIMIATGTIGVCASGSGIFADIISSVISNACEGNPVSTPVVIQFTEPMNQQQTGSFVVGSPDTTPPDITCPSCGADFEINNDGDSCGIIPDDLQNIKTGSASAVNVCNGSPVYIEFSELMDKNSVLNAISISPVLHRQAIWLVGHWSSTDCFWDLNKPVLSPINYKFRGGNAPCGTDTQTDNIRIIFTRPMDIVTTPGAISLRRISPPIAAISKASYFWSDSNHVPTLSFSEDKATGCSGNGPESLDLSNDSLFDSLSNYPFHILEIDQTAKDNTGMQMSAPFNFVIEGD
ncbi:MAG: Ig-like domain-containing protein [Leptospira sp.]|nr:Ig-like domain-containing protein [Leptospira sp.]